MVRMYLHRFFERDTAFAVPHFFTFLDVAHDKICQQPGRNDDEYPAYHLRIIEYVVNVSVIAYDP